MKRNSKKDAQADATQLTTVIVKLENINTICTEIKSDISTIKADVKDLSERLVIVEQSTKSAHKRIDEIGFDSISKTLRTYTRFKLVTESPAMSYTFTDAKANGLFMSNVKAQGNLSGQALSIDKLPSHNVVVLYELASPVWTTITATEKTSSDKTEISLTKISPSASEIYPQGIYSTNSSVKTEDENNENIHTVSISGNAIGSIKDTVEIVKGKCIKTQRIGVIESYNGETITTAYTSTTGGLDLGATVYYVLPNPVVTDISTTEDGKEWLALCTYYPYTHILVTGTNKPTFSAKIRTINKLL